MGGRNPDRPDGKQVTGKAGLYFFCTVILNTPSWRANCF
jgi:hypothetical protein